jgi:hypothetical protein
MKGGRMDRYDFRPDMGGMGDCGCGLEWHPEGDYIKYSDHQATIADLQRQLVDKEAQVKRLGEACEAIIQECNTAGLCDKNSIQHLIKHIQGIAEAALANGKGE